MAVVDKYTDTKFTGNILTGDLLSAGNAAANQLFVAIATFEVAAADDDGSVYRVFKNINPSLIPTQIGISCDAITNGTDWDLGLYKPDLGAVVDKDCLMDGQTLASAAKLGLGALNGMGGVDVADINKRLFEHAGATISTRPEAYDMALTANTVGTAAGTVSITAIFCQG